MPSAFRISPSRLRPGLALLFGELNMNKLPLTMSFVLVVSAAIAVSTFALPASAQNHSRITKDELQPTTWFKARRQVRVEDTTPIVKYDTPAAPEPVYLIPTGLPKAKAAPVVVLPAPTQAGGVGGGVVAPPGYAIVDPSQPSPARFRTNIPAAGMGPGRALPSGNHSSVLTGKMWDAPKSPVGSVAAPARVLPAGEAAPKTAVYQPSRITATGSGSSNTSVKTSVIGDLLKKK